MPLFSRRRATAEPVSATWIPLHPEPVSLSGDAAHMDDDGQAIPFVYQVRFGLPGHPDGPVITCCTYVSYAPADAGYCAGLHYRYTSEARPGWSYAGWEPHPAGEDFSRRETARMVAETWARELAAEYPAAMAGLPQVFDWDGAPWDR